jgi:tetratricopeptide (TPR) repeat protein
MLDLGNLMWDLGRLDQAEQLTRQGLEARRRVLGGDDPDTLASLTQLGRVLVARGQLDEAERCLDETLARIRQRMGEGGAGSYKALIGIGELRYRQGRVADAEPLLRQGIEGYVKAAGETRLTTVNARVTLAQVLRAQARFPEAEEQLLRAESVCPSALGVSSARHRDCIELLGSLYEAWNTIAPGKGHDAKAAEWKGKLEALSAPAPVEPEGKS